MATSQNPFGHMTLEQKQGATFALTQALSWINQPTSTGSSSLATGTNGTLAKAKTKAKRGTSTRGGTSEQHALAGAQSHKNDAPKKRGRRSKAQIAASGYSQQPQS